MKRYILFILFLLFSAVSLSLSQTITPLYFTIGVHVEPFGETYQGYGNDNSKSYNNDIFFKRHYDDILYLAELVGKYDGKMTVQVQSPFTEVLIEKNLPLLSELEKQGHEIALHFHENMHLGNNCNSLPPYKWTEAMSEEIDLIKKAGAKEEIAFWSGGNLYQYLFDAAALAGLSVNADWKNPTTQAVDENMTGLWPWRPMGGYENGSTLKMGTNDPNGKIIYLPQGITDTESFGDKKQIVKESGLSGWLKVIENNLYESLENIDSSKINVFHFTIHPTEFVGDRNNPYAELEDFLKNVITPLVKQGKLKWATFGEKAQMYEENEKNHAKDREKVVVASNTEFDATNCNFDPMDKNIFENMSFDKTVYTSKEGFITFVINVHDISNVEKSADTVNRFIELFDKYGVKGDFYFTAPIIQLYLEKRPDVIQHLKESDMTISYHYRAPHIAYAGFDRELEKMNTDMQRKFLKDYETYAIDMNSGKLDKSKIGGFCLLTEVFGTPPIVASALNYKWRFIQLPLYKNMGAQMTLDYHEGEADPENPFEYKYGLLIRPSDFGVTQWTDDAFPGEESQFWWNHVEDKYSVVFDPITRLKTKLEEWQGSRKPFITSLIHENNMYAKGSTWQNIFYDKSGKPKKPPYDLDSGLTQFRIERNSEAIWKKYEELLAYAVEHLEVITSDDITKMAK